MYESELLFTSHTAIQTRRTSVCKGKFHDYSFIMAISYKISFCKPLLKPFKFPLTLTAVYKLENCRKHSVQWRVLYGLGKCVFLVNHPMILHCLLCVAGGSLIKKINESIKGPLWHTHVNYPPMWVFICIDTSKCFTWLASAMLLYLIMSLKLFIKDIIIPPHFPSPRIEIPCNLTLLILKKRSKNALLWFSVDKSNSFCK